LPAKVALVFAQALNLVNYYYAVLFPFSDGFYRASRNAGGLGTVVAGGGEEGNEQIREFALLYGYHLSPTGWSRWHVVPVFASDHTGITAGAPGLIEVESYLHGSLLVFIDLDEVSLVE